MVKNFQRDINLLMKINMEIDKLSRTLSRFGVKNQSDILNDEDILDLCAFRVFQIGELSKRLTDDSKSDLSFTSTISTAKLRDEIGHAYNTMNKYWLVSVVFMLIKPSIKTEIQNRIIRIDYLPFLALFLARITNL